MENGLFFAATSATYGMPMVVELGIALDVLVGMLILGASVVLAIEAGAVDGASADRRAREGIASKRAFA
jgi:hydrogenase-4 membrane subunit HyfE